MMAAVTGTSCTRVRWISLVPGAGQPTGNPVRPMHPGWMLRLSALVAIGPRQTSASLASTKAYGEGHVVGITTGSMVQFPSFTISGRWFHPKHLGHEAQKYRHQSAQRLHWFCQGNGQIGGYGRFSHTLSLEAMATIFSHAKPMPLIYRAIP